jgi:hypothetical protein
MLGRLRNSDVVAHVADRIGTTFTHWIVDHNVLWTSPTTVEALERSIKYYSFLADAPEGMGWAYIAVGLAAIISAGGQLSKVLKGGQSEVLFDGGSVGTSELWFICAAVLIIKSCSPVSPMFSCRASSRVGPLSYDEFTSDRQRYSLCLLNCRARMDHKLYIRRSHWPPESWLAITSCAQSC